MDQPTLIDHLAMLAHEANRALQSAAGETPSPPWAEAPAWQQASARDGVRNVLENPGLTAGESHANWLRHKEADGWKFGQLKNEQKKEHPCMVPFQQLPLAQQFKDDVFTTIVRYVWNTVEAIRKDAEDAQT